MMLGVNPPGKSRRRRQQGCSAQTLPIHHRRWAGPAPGRNQPRSGPDQPAEHRPRDAAKAEWDRADRTRVPAPQRLEAGPAQTLKERWRETIYLTGR